MQLRGMASTTLICAMMSVAVWLPVLAPPVSAYGFDRSAVLRAATQPSYVPNQVLVTLHPGMSESRMSGFLAEYGGTIVWRPKYSNTYVVQIQGAGTPADNVMGAKPKILQKYTGVRFVDYNCVKHLSISIPNDELYPTIQNPTFPDILDGQWPLRPGKNIYAPEAWDLQKGSDQVIVAVIDSGVRDRYKFDDNGKLIRKIHPDLLGRVLTGLDIADQGDADTANPGPAPSENGALYEGVVTHGTHVAGTIAAQANNWIGVAGLCWDNVWIWPLKVGADKDLEISPAYVIEAIYYCISQTFHVGLDRSTPLRVGVINMSLGSPMPSDAEAAAVRYATDSGIIICASAGNDWTTGPYAPGYPGAYEDVICVGATDHADLVTSFSNRGSALDISAPGEYVLSTVWYKRLCSVDTEKPEPTTTMQSTASLKATTWPVPVPWPTWPDKYGNDFQYMDGTSMASPHVAAAVALLLSHGVPPGDVKELLYSTATPMGLGRPNAAYGWGVLNIGAAIKKASIDVTIGSPGKGAVTPTLRPRFRIDFRHAMKDSIRVWIDGVDTNLDGVPDGPPTIGGNSPEITDWDKYYYLLDEKAGKTFLLFEYPVDTASAINGVHRVYATAESDINFESPPPVPVADADFTQFRVESQTLGAGWRLFAVPYKFADGKRPDEILGTVGMLARWHYANNPFGDYAYYSLDRSRTDDEASFTPLSAYANYTVHPVGPHDATPPAGLGYWLYLPSASAVAMPEGAGETVSESPYNIDLYYGWNMVGDPFAFPVAWSTAVIEYAGERLTAEEAVQRGWISNSFFRYDPVLRRYTYKQADSAIMRPWESQWVKVKVRTPDQTPSVPSPWKDEFNDGVVDEWDPEPAWFRGETYGQATEAGGMLRLVGADGRPSKVYVADSSYPMYRDFAVDAMLYLANPAPTIPGGRANAEIRFRENTSGEACSLAFIADEIPNHIIISLRNSNTEAVIKRTQPGMEPDLTIGMELYVNIMCMGSRIKVRVGTRPGLADIEDWCIEDNSFVLPGCFYLVNDGMMDCRWDYFKYRSITTRPPDLKITVPPNAYTGAL